MVNYEQSIPSILLQTGAAGTVLTSGATNDLSQASWIQGPAVMIGGVIMWAKTIPGVPALPAGFVECNGQVLVDAESAMDGETMPAMNTPSSRFPRGNTTSGGVGGADSLNLTHTEVASPNDYASTGGTDAYATHTFDPKPPFYDFVFVIRVK